MRGAEAVGLVDLLGDRRGSGFPDADKSLQVGSFFERLKGETPDLKSLLVCFLAIEGLRSMNLFDSDVLSADERRLLVSALLEIAG